jgi:hypothetical protein
MPKHKMSHSMIGKKRFLPVRLPATLLQAATSPQTLVFAECFI